MEKKKWEEGKEQRETERKEYILKLKQSEQLKEIRNRQLSQMELCLLFIRTKNYKLLKNINKII